MANSNVPKFGNWENEENDVPYTVYFEKARKNKGGKMINPNDPQENPDMFRNFAPSPPPPAPAPAPAGLSRPRSRPEKPFGRGAVGPTPDRRMSREEGDDRNLNNINSPAHGENLGQKTANESTQQNYGGRGMRYNRPAMSSAGSEHSIDRSPLHPHYQARNVEGGIGSPAQEGKNSYDSSHGNPGKSRLKPVFRGAESPDGGAAVPRFGEWNENDPQSAENFTDIFNKVREEKNAGSANVSTTPKHPSYLAQNHQPKEKPKKCCCFPWW